MCRAKKTTQPGEVNFRPIGRAPLHQPMMHVVALAHAHTYTYTHKQSRQSKPQTNNSKKRKREKKKCPSGRNLEITYAGGKHLQRSAENCK